MQELTRAVAPLDWHRSFFAFLVSVYLYALGRLLGRGLLYADQFLTDYARNKGHAPHDAVYILGEISIRLPSFFAVLGITFALSELVRPILRIGLLYDFAFRREAISFAINVSDFF